LRATAPKIQTTKFDSDHLHCPEIVFLNGWKRDLSVGLLVFAIRTCARGMRRCGSSFARQKSISLQSKSEQVFFGRFPKGIVKIAVCVSDLDAFLGRFKLRPTDANPKVHKTLIIIPTFGYEGIHLALQD
jgi:hypothetical protein